jgi:hypothetical protein
MHGECKLLFTDPTKNVQADINLFFCSVTPCADWLQAHAKAAWNVFNHASKSTIPQKSLVSVKVWNKVRSRKPLSNLSCTKWTQTKQNKTWKFRVSLTHFSLTRFLSQRSRWKTDQSTETKWISVRWANWTPVQLRIYSKNSTNLVMQKRLYQSRNVQNVHMQKLKHG